VYSKRLDENMADLSYINGATLLLLSMMLAQGLLVFALHSLEILVNMSRDEDVWRLAISDKGVRHEYNAIIAALRSPQTLMLFGGKAVAHWAIGQSVSIRGGAITIMYLFSLPYWRGWHVSGHTWPRENRKDLYLQHMGTSRLLQI